MCDRAERGPNVQARMQALHLKLLCPQCAVLEVGHCWGRAPQRGQIGNRFWYATLPAHRSTGAPCRRPGRATHWRMVLRRQAARSTSKSTGPMHVPLQPRQCLIEITFRQLHLFLAADRLQSRATSQPVSAWRRWLGVAIRSNNASSYTLILCECRPKDELRLSRQDRAATTAITVATSK